MEPVDNVAVHGRFHWRDVVTSSYIIDSKQVECRESVQTADSGEREMGGWGRMEVKDKKQDAVLTRPGAQCVHMVALTASFLPWTTTTCLLPPATSTCAGDSLCLACFISTLDEPREQVVSKLHASPIARE